MSDNLSCDPKVSSPDYLFSFGDWYRVDEYLDKDFDGACDYLNLNWECKSYSKMVSQSPDILDMLPSDPFEMNMSGGCTMFRGWIEEMDQGMVEDENDDELFLGLNLVLTEATRIQQRVSGKSIRDEFNKESLDRGCDGLFLFDGGKESSHEKFSNSRNEEVESFSDGPPSDALFFALGYLGVRDLLCVERVCKSLGEGVRNDPLLWRSIHVDQPGETFTDESLLRLTSRANGSLQCLSLVKCLKITDNGLRSVLHSNPGLTKLSVPGCIGLSVEGLVSDVKALKSMGGPGIKHLRIGGLVGLTMDHFEELKHVLEFGPGPGPSRPRIYRGAQPYLSFDDERALDVEPCPKCQQPRQVYDCPSDACRGCKACTFCVARCVNCGCCFNERGYMETFCLDFLCLDCLTQFLEFPEDMSLVSKPSQTRYRFCLYA